MARFVFQQIILWLIMIIAVVLIAFLPRELVFVSSEYRTYGVVTFDGRGYWERIRDYIAMVFSGSLGVNRYGTSVVDDLQVYGIRSFQLIFFAFIVSFIIGGVKAYFDIRMKGPLARFSRSASNMMQAVPDFFVIIVVQMLLLWLFRQGFPQFSIYGNEHVSTVILAVCLLSIFPSFYFSNIVMQALDNERGKFYLTAAKGRGVSNRKLLIKHQFANALPTVINQVPMMFVYVLSNLLIVEFLLSFRGAMHRTYLAMGFHGSVQESIPNLSYIEEHVIVLYLSAFISLGFLINVLCKTITAYWYVGRTAE